MNDKPTNATLFAIMQDGHLEEPFRYPNDTAFYQTEAEARAELTEWIADLGDDAQGIGIVRIDATITQIAAVSAAGEVTS